MNLIQIAGFLGADPEERVTPGGQKVITLRVAARYRRGKTDETIWYRVTIWGDRFDRILPYLKKGSAVIVIGELHPPEIYTNRDGQPQVSLEITAEVIRFSPFGRPDRADQQGSPAMQSAMTVSPSNESGFDPLAGGGAAPSLPEDDLPF